VLTLCSMGAERVVTAISAPARKEEAKRRGDTRRAFQIGRGKSELKTAPEIFGFDVNKSKLFPFADV